MHLNVYDGAKRWNNFLSPSWHFTSPSLHDSPHAVPTQWYGSHSYFSNSFSIMKQQKPNVIQTLKRRFSFTGEKNKDKFLKGGGVGWIVKRCKTNWTNQPHYTNYTCLPRKKFFLIRFPSLTWELPFCAHAFRETKLMVGFFPQNALETGKCDLY